MGKITDVLKKYGINKKETQERLDKFLSEENIRKRNFAKKYSDRMEELIVERFSDAPKGQTRLETAELIHAHFTANFSPLKMKDITAKGLLKKYYNLMRDGKHFEEGTGIYSDDTPLDDTPLDESTPSTSTSSTVRDLIFSAMQKSEDMTINVQGKTITVILR
jgi:hypothetical protein